MVFSFKYKPIQIKSGKTLYRPMIPLTIEGKEKINLIGILDSGSDISIIPREIAEIINIEYVGENEISGIYGMPVKAKQGRVRIEFGKGREISCFDIPVLVPLKEGISVIIGRLGFFEQFKITFSEAERKIEFKKFKNYFITDILKIN